MNKYGSSMILNNSFQALNYKYKKRFKERRLITSDSDNRHLMSSALALLLKVGLLFDRNTDRSSLLLCLSALQNQYIPAVKLNPKWVRSFQTAGQVFIYEGKMLNPGRGGTVLVPSFPSTLPFSTQWKGSYFSPVIGNAFSTQMNFGLGVHNR